MKAPISVSGMMLSTNCVVRQVLRRGGVGRDGAHVARGRIEVHARAGLEGSRDDQSDDQRDRRDHLEVQQRPEADAADLLHRPGLRDPDDDRREDDRSDEHPHQLDEAVAERLHRGAVLRREKPSSAPSGDADEHLDIESRQVAACRPRGVRFLVHSL